MDIKPIAFSSLVSGVNLDTDPRVSAGEGFQEMLTRQLTETDQAMREAKDLNERAALGNAGVELHDAQIAAARADLHLRFLMQTRNKALEAYKEVMSMPV